MKIWNAEALEKRSTGPVAVADPTSSVGGQSTTPRPRLGSVYLGKGKMRKEIKESKKWNVENVERNVKRNVERNARNVEI